MICKTSPEMSPINLQGGWPTPRLHPVEALQSASQDLFARGDIHEALKYGPEYGDISLREDIGKWLADAYQPSAGPIGHERIIATNGASNGLATVLQKFADPVLTSNIWMVEPAYFLACPIFRDAGFTGKIRGVPEGSGCIDLDFFQAALEEADKNAKSPGSAKPTKSAKNGYSKIFRHILYMVPTFSNPSGKTMSIEDREKLIKVARDYDVLVVTDDVYDLLSWSVDEGDDSKNSTCLPRLVDLDRSLPGTNEFGNAVSNGSFSKIVAPGVRLGWLEATQSFISAMGTVGATVSGGCQGHFSSLVLGEMLKNGAVSRHLKEVLIPTYRRRYNTFVDAIRKRLYPYGVRIMTDIEDESNPETGLAGGFFLYIIFPDDGSLPPTSEIAKIALDQWNLRIAQGALFAVSDDSDENGSRSAVYKRGARLCWAWHEEETLVEGIERLAQLLGELQVTH